MVISQVNYLILFVISYLLVGLLTPIMRNIAVAQGVLDLPNSSHKSHKKPVPYLGGIAIISGVLIVTYLAIISFKFTWSNFWLVNSILGPAVAMGLVGLWDDLKNLNPLPRIIGQSIAGLVIAILLILNDNIGNPTGIIELDVLITVLWIVGICNSINFFDNLDGGAAGTVAIASISLAYLAITSNQYFIAALSVVLAGSTFGFLIWNRTPARIYMGDAGSLFLGVLIATLTIRFKPDTDNSITSFAIPILLLAIPILDTTVAVISRLRRGVSPFQGGKDHLSHRLVRYGLSRRIAAVALWLLSALYGLFALLISKSDSDYEIALLVIASAAWLTLLVIFLSTKDE
jgi:UDP-GlcNAc:undecaprenyl-phosphate GlcNAc-1-phosphate transferase